MSTETIDYYKLGERVRRYRKELGMSQDDLAELADISVTHMSHIETGNTKLSLTVLVKLANALCVSTDLLIFGETGDGKWPAHREASLILDACDSAEQADILVELMRGSLITLNRYRRRP